MCPLNKLGLSGLGGAFTPPHSSLKCLLAKCCCAKFATSRLSSAAAPRGTRAATSPLPRSCPSKLTRSRSSPSRCPTLADSSAWSPVKPCWCLWDNFQSRRRPFLGVSIGFYQIGFLRPTSTQCWRALSDAASTENIESSGPHLSRFRSVAVESACGLGLIRGACRREWRRRSCLESRTGKASGSLKGKLPKIPTATA